MPIIKRETDYALRALVRLARTGDFMPVSALAESEDTPGDFLRKIMQALNRAGIVESRQGPFGGYRLARPPARLSLLQVLEAVQGPLVVNECFEAPEICSRSSGCPLRSHLSQLQRNICEQMERMRLSDILNQIPVQDRTDT